MIDLDRAAPPASASNRPPLPRLRPLALALAAALVLTVGGAAPVASALWRRVGLIPLDPPGSTSILTGDHLYTVHRPDQGPMRLTGWSLAPLTRIWTSTAPQRPPAEGIPSAALRLGSTPEGLFLRSADFTSAVVDSATGRLRWRTPGWAQAIGPGVAVVPETFFRAGTEYDQSSGEPGDLFFSATGQPHVEPPRRTVLHGVDATTGQPRWTAEFRGSVDTVQFIGTPAALVVASADRITRLDATTGRITREQRLPQAQTSWVEQAGDLVLLHRVRRGPGDATVDAYALATLDRLWTAPDPPFTGGTGSCEGLPCTTGVDGLSVLDPATGKPRWRVGPDLDLARRGDAVLAVERGSKRPVRLLDPGTGRTRVTLDGWDEEVPAVADGTPLVVMRSDPDRPAATFGVLLPGRTTVQPLGSIPAVVQGCTAVPRFVSCWTQAGIEVWSYGSPGAQ